MEEEEFGKIEIELKKNKEMLAIKNYQQVIAEQISLIMKEASKNKKLYSLKLILR